MKEVRMIICIILICSEGVIVSASACPVSESFFLSAADSVEQTSVVIAEPFNADTVIGSSLSLSLDTAEVKKKTSFFRRFLNYFNDANKPKPRKKFDFSIIGGPHYSSDTKLGLGLVAAGLYQGKDTLMQPSMVSLYGDVSTTGFYLLGVKGTHFFPEDKYRLLYNLYFFSFPGYFWGTGYEAGSNDDNKGSYKGIQNQVKIDFLFRLANNLYAGPLASFDYVAGSNFEKPETLNGAAKSTLSVGVGGSISYDTRDFQTNSYKGVYLKLEQSLSPCFLGNKDVFYTTDVLADIYQKVWKGGILAIDIHAKFTFGDTPWTMMPKLGGSLRMRGYYEGQYRDRNVGEIQVELRQHVWKRNGVVFWVGAGNVFHDFRSFKWSHTLPNYGLGYRWEFKKRVNVRLDYGFGKGQSGFLFNINEAF